jgi:hypothetical protein
MAASAFLLSTLKAGNMAAAKGNARSGGGWGVAEVALFVRLRFRQACKFRWR